MSEWDPDERVHAVGRINDPGAPVVGTPEPDDSGCGTRQKMRAEIVRLRGALEVIATTTYPATYLGESKDGVKLYGGSRDASRFARGILDPERNEEGGEHG